MSDITRREVARQLVHSSGLSILIKVANGFLAYLMMVLIARASTPEQYGVFAVAFSIAVSASFISTAGQPRAIIRYWQQWMSQQGPSKARAALKFSMIITTLGLGATVLIMALGGALDFILEMPWTFGLAMATALFAFAMGWAEFSSAGLRAQEFVVRALAPRDVGWRALVCLIFGGAALANIRFDGITIVLIMAGVLAVFVSPQVIALIRSTQGTSLAQLTTADRKLFLRSSFFMWGMYALDTARNYAGIIIVSAFLGTGAAGGYFAAERTANLLSFILLAVNLAAAPHISKHYHSGRSDMVMIIVMICGLTAGLAASVGLLFFIFLGDNILAVFNPTYVSYVPVLYILAIGQLVQASTGVAGLLLTMSGHERENLYINLCIGAAGITLQVVGGFLFGPIGVATAAAAGTICLRVTVTRYARRKLQIDATGISSIPRTLRSVHKLLRQS
jgi:O-antigen/teichoic acid export membrane protein